MALTLGLILADAGLDSTDAIVLRHAFMAERGGIHADSSDEEILAYTAEQSVASQHFLAKPPFAGWCSSERVEPKHVYGQSLIIAVRFDAMTRCGGSMWLQLMT